MTTSSQMLHKFKDGKKEMLQLEIIYLPLLKTIYEIHSAQQQQQPISDNRLILLQQFTEYKFQQGHNVTSHVTALELLWSRLTEIGEHILESQVIAEILSTLPSTYRHFYTTWNNSPEAGRTVKLLLTKLQEEEEITQAFNRNNPSTEGAYAAPNHFQNPAQRNQNQSL
ncbi:hypothetical protein DAPPUDRAFT_116135 [Daphnia pulex]|uniref:Uncharacterized protein n=1 Tax=Daphnia pulex TaxID=6669 RepID=E9HNP1_DAPPU|nr:hypothetical protein DAPPUDRAFT_116135 [Daphnia pulex]|eukprot:EFX66643.1 hypothetical protein DAPPUDRAFT_116135 [Daphnia pulex]